MDLDVKRLLMGLAAMVLVFLAVVISGGHLQCGFFQ